MSSRQFTQFGGSGEIVTLDDINEYDDLPPLAEIDSPDVYEIRTGELGTDYLVPMQDGSTDFNQWYSLVDGQIIRAIPDSVVNNLDHAHLIDEGEGAVLNPAGVDDGLQDIASSFNGSPTWVEDDDAPFGWKIDMSASDGWRGDSQYPDADIDDKISVCGWINLDGVSVSNNLSVFFGSHEDMGSLNSSGDGIVAALYDNDELSVEVSDGGSFRAETSPTYGVNVSDENVVFFGGSQEVDGENTILDIHVWNETSHIGDDQNEDHFTSVSDWSNQFPQSPDSISDSNIDPADGEEMFFGVAFDKLPKSAFEDIWNDTKP